METHTKGPWRVNERLLAIVSDEPCTDILGAENVEHYGGYLIAESIAPRNLSIIAAAPNMYEAISAAVHAMKMGFEGNEIFARGSPILEGMLAAIAKAEGK